MVEKCIIDYQLPPGGHLDLKLDIILVKKNSRNKGCFSGLDNVRPFII